VNTFIAYILLCASSVAPSDCDRKNAIDVAIGPQTGNEIACGIEAQQMIAQTAIRPRGGEYIKISCVRRRASDAERAAPGTPESTAENADAPGAAKDQ
jgi:hypothetical protein